MYYIDEDIQYLDDELYKIYLNDELSKRFKLIGTPKTNIYGDIYEKLLDLCVTLNKSTQDGID